MNPAPPGVRDYRRLFAAYVTALLGAGIATVGLALLAFDLAGDDAGQVIATALSIKVFAYVFIAPVAAALTGRVAKKALLIGLDLARAAAILALPAAEAVWQVYVAVFVFAAAGAAFTPTYQALAPLLLPTPEDHARALSKSRIADELENGISPAVAAGLLVVLSLAGLFVTAMLAFLISAAFVATTRLPTPPVPPGALRDRLLLGPRIMATTPGLRGLAPAHLAAAAGIAMVMVNTVGFVQGDLGLGDRAAALAFAAFGAGSVGGALAAPALMAAAGDRGTMLGGCALVAGGLLLGGLAAPGYGGLLALWALVGAGSAAALTPAQALLRRVAPARELGVLYAALFALANLALLVAYPAAGWLGTALDPPAALAAAGGLAAVAGLAAARGLARAATPPAG